MCNYQGLVVFYDLLIFCNLGLLLHNKLLNKESIYDLSKMQFRDLFL